MNIVGMMWNKNEADILEEIILDALKNVDSLFIADDGSTDASWDIIESLKKRYPAIEHIQQAPDPKDQGQRNQLLDAIRRAYKYDDTWVQIVESDIMILDTDIREAVKHYTDEKDLAVSWQTLNAIRKPGTWSGADRWPNWDCPIKDIIPYAHWMEVMTYTFRPMPKLHYSGPWRPWPRGWTSYTDKKVKTVGKNPGSPLLAHYGYRGPTHFHNKYKHFGKSHRRHPTWDLTSPETIEETVSFFNGTWNNNTFLMSREGWKQSRGWK